MHPLRSARLSHTLSLLSSTLGLALGEVPNALADPRQPQEIAIEIQELAPWRLNPGQTRTYALPPSETLERFTVSGDAIRAAPLPGAPHALLIKAIRQGQGELWLWTQSKKALHLAIQVQEPVEAGEGSESHPLRAASEALREVNSLWTGSVLVLSGQIQTEAELLRVRALAESQANLVRDQTELAPPLLALGRSKLQSWIQSESLESVLRIQEQAGQLHVIGVAPNAQARSSWEQRLRSIFAGARLEITTLQNPDQTLYFRVALLELKKRAFQTLGLQWPSQLHSQLSHAALQAPLDLQLQALEREGAARVLSQPELVVRVPGEAELFSGGEIPIEMRTIRGPQVDWKAYGLSLKLKALELAGEQVRLEISSEVSDLDRANGTANIPALQASRLKTQVDARIGKPLLLSGLFQRRSSKSGEGIPFLQKIPVAGLLFGAQSKIEEHSELVAMLLPLRSPPEPASNPTPPVSSPPMRPQRHSERDYMTPGLARER